MSDNRRRHLRARVRQRIWCEGDHVTLYVQAINAGLGGMFIRAASPLDRGRCRVSFTDLEDGQVIANVEVVWSQTDPSMGEPGMGVRIVGFERGEDSFTRFIERHLALTP
jgi:hypothetical protein